MSRLFSIILVLFVNTVVAQQYDYLYIEKDNIDENNKTYKVNNFYTYDYEIIIEGESYRLKKNESDKSELILDSSDLVDIEKIHLLVTEPLIAEGRTNENQTEITYYQVPIYSTYEVTGVVDNERNVWIHPSRSGFFRSLETCPFPYILKPFEIGREWSDSMLIGHRWGDEIWGVWESNLLLRYNYKLIGEENIQTELGELECYVVESSASSFLGVTNLKSYFSEKYGFMRLEYELLTGIKVNIWLIDFKENQEFNNGGEIFGTGKIIKD